MIFLSPCEITSFRGIYQISKTLFTKSSSYLQPTSPQKPTGSHAFPPSFFGASQPIYYFCRRNKT